MPKRKRDGEWGERDEKSDQDDHIEDQALRIRVSRLRAKVDQGNKALTAALKLARGLERQKLGRRQKVASDKPHTLLRLREEVIFLKQLDLSQMAKSYLIKQMEKTKRIKTSPAFVRMYGEDLPKPKVNPGAEANIIGRLFSSKPIKEIMPDIMSSLYRVLGISQKTPKVNQSGNPTHSSSMVSASPSDGGSDAAVNEDDNFQSLDRQRLNSISDDEIRDDDGDDALMSDHEGRSPDEEGDDNTAEAQQRSILTVSKTAFLPSLSMGGYYSGSESGDDGDNNIGLGPRLPLERKNRRGQRARQQLAELKFGKNAKHLQKRSKNLNRDSGWDTKRGAVENNDGRRGKFMRPTSGGTRVKRVGQGEVPQRKPASPGGKGRDDTGALHPSWEAARQRKMQDTGPAVFRGKKITFD